MRVLGPSEWPEEISGFLGAGPSPLTRNVGKARDDALLMKLNELGKVKRHSTENGLRTERRKFVSNKAHQPTPLRGAAVG